MDLISQSQMYLEEIAKRRNDSCCDMQPLETNWFNCENAAVIFFFFYNELPQKKKKKTCVWYQTILRMVTVSQATDILKPSASWLGLGRTFPLACSRHADIPIRSIIKSHFGPPNTLTQFIHTERGSSSHCRPPPPPPHTNIHNDTVSKPSTVDLFGLLYLLFAHLCWESESSGNSMSESSHWKRKTRTSQPSFSCVKRIMNMQFQALIVFIGERYSVLDYSSTGFSLTGSKVWPDVWICFFI